MHRRSNGASAVSIPSEKPGADATGQGGPVALRGGKFRKEGRARPQRAAPRPAERLADGATFGSNPDLSPERSMRAQASGGAAVNLLGDALAPD